MTFRAFGPSAALVLFLGGCDAPRSPADVDLVPRDAVQRRETGLVDPQRYLRLTDLAAAIRTAGFPCEVVKAYKKIAQSGPNGAVYKIDCLEYSFRLTILNGQSRLEPFQER